MKQSRRGKKKVSHGGVGDAKSRVGRAGGAKAEVGVDLVDYNKREKWLRISLVVLLLLLGVYHSVVFFGHQAVPNSDFPSFMRAGRALWSFHLPGSFKRGPGLGLLLVPLSRIVDLVGSSHPDLTAGWLLNAIFYPLNLVLLWLIGSKIIGNSAWWVAVVAMVNPWVVYLLTEPIAETTFLFFVLLTFFLMFRGSRWCYLVAAMAAITRYEAAALIFVAFVLDMLRVKGMRARLISFCLAVSAVVPFGLWMLATVLHGRSSGHYTQFLGDEQLSGIPKAFGSLWDVSISPLLRAAFEADESLVGPVGMASKIATVVCFIIGAVWSMIKQRWEVLGLLCFFVPYMVIHVLYPFYNHRFFVIVHWIVLLVCVLGLGGIWSLINKGNRIPRIVVIVLQSLVVVLAVLLLIGIVSHLPSLKRFGPGASGTAYVVFALFGLAFAAFAYCYRQKGMLRVVLISLLACLAIGSNQYILAGIMSQGDRDIEFKYLAQWFVANAEPGEKLVSTLPSVVRIYAPQRGGSIVHVNAFKADDPQGFVRKCRKAKITYVAWDSRSGFSAKGFYYNDWCLKNIEMLASGRDIGPYRFVTRIKHPRVRYRFINVFRLEK